MGCNPTAKSGEHSLKRRQPPELNERLDFGADFTAAYEQEEQDSLTAFSTASRVSPVRF